MLAAAGADPAQEMTVASTSAKSEEFGGPRVVPLEKIFGATPLGLPENDLSIKESGLSVHLLERDITRLEKRIIQIKRNPEIESFLSYYRSRNLSKIEAINSRIGKSIQLLNNIENKTGL